MGSGRIEAFFITEPSFLAIMRDHQKRFVTDINTSTGLWLP
jgi:hypothetical protein